MQNASSACKQQSSSANNSANDEQPRKVVLNLPVPVRPGERWFTMAGADGQLVTQKVPDDAVIIRRADLPVGWG